MTILTAYEEGGGFRKMFPKNSYTARKLTYLCSVKQKGAEDAGINTKNCYY